MRNRIPRDRHAAIVGHVQPLVTIGRPAIGPFHPGDQRGEALAGIGPQSEGAIDVDPCARRLRHRTQRREIIAGTDVEVTRIEDDNRRCLGCERQRIAQHVG